MPWKIATNEDIDLIIEYLKKDEWLSVQILSLFIENNKITFPKETKIINLIKTNGIKLEGIISISSNGLIYPRIEKNLKTQSDKNELIKLLATIKFMTHGVVGLKEDVEFLDSVIFKPIRHINRYILMHRESVDYFDKTSSIDVLKASVKHHHSLLPLELEYQREEVIISEVDFNKKALSFNFKKKLQNNDIYFISNGKMPICKGGTTYKSLNYTLLGGIFTWANLRNRGLSTRLLKFLINDQLNIGFKCALFVREENHTAIHLYNKLGFIDNRKYQINYYKR